MFYNNSFISFSGLKILLIKNIQCGDNDKNFNLINHSRKRLQRKTKNNRKTEIISDCLLNGIKFQQVQYAILSQINIYGALVNSYLRQQ